MRGSKDIAKFILSNYTGRIAEIGIGHNLEVAMHLPDVIATDIIPIEAEGVSVIIDDIFDPREEIYHGVSLIYAIRPPLEMQVAMADLARRVGADILIRPMDDEIADLQGFKRELICIGEASFYLYRRKP